MESATRVQILKVAVCICLCADALGRYINRFWGNSGKDWVLFRLIQLIKKMMLCQILIVVERLDRYIQLVWVQSFPSSQVWCNQSPYNLSPVGRRADRFMPFPRALVRLKNANNLVQDLNTSRRFCFSRLFMYITEKKKPQFSWEIRIVLFSIWEKQNC